MKNKFIQIFNPFINILLFLFSLKTVQALVDIMLHFLLKLKGYKNFGSFRLTGEEFFLNKIKDYDIKYSLDIGANTGNYSEKIIKITKSKVISFEPSIDSFSKLRKLKKKYPKQLFIYKVALSNKNTILKFYSVGKNSQLASFEKNINKFSYVNKKNIKIKKLKTLIGDNFLKKLKIKGSIDFIKIDTEGHDFKVLLGLKKTIDQHKPKFIQFEMNWHYLFNGYNIFKISSQFKDYNIYRMLPYKSGIIKIDPNHPNNNLFHLSNYVLVRKEISLN
tara:strand:+ start:195 stop:1022 length:828 start_codon:yes stop_codon:yes gene_type:complete